MVEAEAVVAEAAPEAGEGAPAHGVAAEGATRSRAGSPAGEPTPTPPQAWVLSKREQKK